MAALSYPGFSLTAQAGSELFCTSTPKRVLGVGNPTSSAPGRVPNQRPHGVCLASNEPGSPPRSHLPALEFSSLRIVSLGLIVQLRQTRRLAMAQGVQSTARAEAVSKGVRMPATVKLVVALEALLACISIPPGVILLQDPSGSSIGMPSSVISILHGDLPFINDFRPVGVWLILVYGVLPVAVAWGMWRAKGWAWYLSSLLGAVVAIWIGSELVMFSTVGFTWFYPLIGGIGLAILALSLFPSSRRYCFQA